MSHHNLPGHHEELIGDVNYQHPQSLSFHSWLNLREERGEGKGKKMDGSMNKIFDGPP